jgi:hypothetical protein
MRVLTLLRIPLAFQFLSLLPQLTVGTVLPALGSCRHVGRYSTRRSLRVR